MWSSQEDSKPAPSENCPDEDQSSHVGLSTVGPLAFGKLDRKYWIYGHIVINATI